MVVKIFIIFAWTLLVWSGISCAQMYTWTDEQGVLVISVYPRPNDNIKEELEIPATKRVNKKNKSRSSASPQSHASKYGPDNISDEMLQGDNSIVWKTWSEGLSVARSNNKPICLFIYTTWCPRCHELIPKFDDIAIVRLSKKFVMIKQDADEKPSWLTEHFGRFGGYIPRIFFMRSDGKVIKEINSGNPRYPYYYSDRDVEKLRASFKKASVLR
jgi:thiol-disulfide isomerase/thioredoxin